METEEKQDVDSPKNDAGIGDIYCWQCHVKCVKKKFNCTECFRCFHDKCINNVDESNRLNQRSHTLICSVCISLERSKADFADKPLVLDLLNHLMAKILMDPYLKVLKNLDSIAGIAHRMDLNTINQKVNNRLYESLNSFLEDVNTVCHNCSSIEQHKINAQHLVKVCKSQVESIRSCGDCYQNMHTKSDGVTLPCSWPHLVLWVRLNRSSGYWITEKGYTHWPAKLVAIDRQNATVIFFDGSDFVQVPRTNCFIYSTIAPEAIKSTVNTKDMDDVLNMVNLYAENISQKFGRMHMNSETIPLDQSPLVTHMRTMFPEFESSFIIGCQNLDTSGEAERGGRNKKFSDVRVSINRSRIRDDDTRSEQSLDEASGSNDTNIIPNKMRRISKESPIKKLETSERLKALDKSIELMKNVRKSVKESENENQWTIQALRRDLETSKRSQAESEAKNNELIRQLNAVSVERDEAKFAKSKAVTELALVKEEHAKEIAALKKTHDEAAATAKTTIEQLQQDKLGLEKDHDSRLDALRKEHDERSKFDSQKLKAEQEKVTKLKENLQNAIDEKIRGEAQLTGKYSKIVKNLKDEAKKCKSCGEIKPELFCSEICKSLWTNVLPKK